MRALSPKKTPKLSWFSTSMTRLEMFYGMNRPMHRVMIKSNGAFESGDFRGAD